MKRPKRRTGPRWVCIVDQRAARLLCGTVPINHRCRSRGHQHLKHEDVVRMVRAGELTWVDATNHKIAVYADERVWAKARSGPVHTMQLVPKWIALAKRKQQ